MSSNANKIRIRKAYSTDRADAESRNTADTKDNGSINFIDDTDDEGLGEEKHKLMDKKQVRSQWILTIL